MGSRNAPHLLGDMVKLSHLYESIDESNARKPTREEHIALLERKKRSLLHELKILSVQISQWITKNIISQMGDGDKHPDAIKIPDSETRRILTKDPLLQQKILKTFARFTTAREILSNSVMPELDALNSQGENTVS